ncbi:MAG: T9SS type A sorting domain-containing protein [Bacteroidota bacterium]
MKKIQIMFFTMMVWFIYNSTLDAQIQLKNYVVGNGASTLTGSSYALSVTVGQPIIGNASNSLHSNNMGFWYQYAETITDVENSWMFETPREFELFQNYPNPFNPTTIIRYGLPKESSVKIIVYNILGEKIITLVDNVQKAGYYEINFNASNLASGVYIYSIQSRVLDGSKDYRNIKKMILLR